MPGTGLLLTVNSLVVTDATRCRYDEQAIEYPMVAATATTAVQNYI